MSQTDTPPVASDRTEPQAPQALGWRSHGDASLREVFERLLALADEPGDRAHLKRRIDGQAALAYPTL